MADDGKGLHFGFQIADLRSFINLLKKSETILQFPVPNSKIQNPKWSHSEFPIPHSTIRNPHSKIRTKGGFSGLSSYF